MKIKVISSISPDHNGMKLEINRYHKRKTGKVASMWKLNNTLLNKQWVKEEHIGKLENMLR